MSYMSKMKIHAHLRKHTIAKGESLHSLQEHGRLQTQNHPEKREGRNNSDVFDGSREEIILSRRWLLKHFPKFDRHDMTSVEDGRTPTVSDLHDEFRKVMALKFYHAHKRN